MIFFCAIFLFNVLCTHAQGFKSSEDVKWHIAEQVKLAHRNHSNLRHLSESVISCSTCTDTIKAAIDLGCGTNNPSLFLRIAVTIACEVVGEVIRDSTLPAGICEALGVSDCASRSYTPVYSGYQSRDSCGGSTYPGQNDASLSSCFTGNGIVGAWAATCSNDGKTVIVSEFDLNGCTIGLPQHSWSISSGKCTFLTIQGMGSGQFTCKPGCLHPTSRATLVDGSQVAISALHPGDVVLASDDENNQLTWSPVYTDTHNDASLKVKYIHFTTATNEQIMATPYHYLKVSKNGDGSVCNVGEGNHVVQASPSTFNYLRAKDVVIGDFLLVIRNTVVHDANMECNTPGMCIERQPLETRRFPIGHPTSLQVFCSPVTNISIAEETGVNSPYTLAGNIVVNGIVAGVYSDTRFDFQKAHKKTLLARFAWKATTSDYFPTSLLQSIDIIKPLALDAVAQGISFCLTWFLELSPVVIVTTISAAAGCWFFIREKKN